MFRSKQFLADNFTNPAGVLAFMRAYGASFPKEATIAKWFTRGTVPSEWLPVLLGYMEIDRGAPVSIIKYLGGV